MLTFGSLAAVLSDNDHAFAMWTDEPPPGVGGATQVLLAHSAVGPTFHRTRTLASFTEPTGVRLTPGAVGAERLSDEGVALLWPAMVSGNYVVEAAGVSETGVRPPSILSESGQDVRLAAVATGPEDEFVVVVALGLGLGGGLLLLVLVRFAAGDAQQRRARHARARLRPARRDRAERTQHRSVGRDRPGHRHGAGCLADERRGRAARRIRGRQR